MTTLDELIADTLSERKGSLSFEEFVQLALYHPELGFYAIGGQAGRRRGDFITSVEVGPLFAAVVGDWLDDKWRDAGEPAEFRVAEAAAGVGTLFRGIHRSQPACYDALMWTLVETSAAMRAAHTDLPAEQWRSSGEIPPNSQHVILANELLDNLPFGIVEKTDQGWKPVSVARSGNGLGLTVGGPDYATDILTCLDTDAPLGSRLPIALHAVDWVATARASANHVLIFDYVATTEQLIERGRQGWLRAYRGHQRIVDIFNDVGTFDITHDVPIDQLPPATVSSTQTDWLKANGIEARVAVARETWRKRAHIGDLAAMAARSVVNEAEAITDPAGLGGFSVLEWSGEPQI